MINITIRVFSINSYTFAAVLKKFLTYKVKRYKYFLIAVLLAVFPNFIQAQTDSIQLEDIVVTGNRIVMPLRTINLSTSVITRKEINKFPGSVPADWLSNVSGVDIRQRGPVGVQTDLSIRGSSFDQSLLLLNGLKLNDPQTGHHNFNLPLMPDAIEQIDVIKTSASRLYGINALAGAINFTTKVPAQNQLYINTYGGNYGLVSVQTGVAYSYKKSATHVAYHHSQSSGYKANTDFSMQTVFLQQTFTLTNQSINIIGGYSDRDFGAHGFYVKNSNEFESIQTAFAGIIHKVNAGKLQWKNQAYFRFNQDHYVFDRMRPTFFHNRHFTHVGGIESHLTYKSNLGETGVGFDFRSEDLRSSNLGAHNRNILGLFLEHKFQFFNEKLTLTPGVYSNTLTNSTHPTFFPGIDFGWVLMDNLKLYSSISKGMRLPTYTDLYYKGTNTTGNAQLVAEAAVSSEVGVKYFHKNGSFSITGFSRNSTNLIDWVRKDTSEKWQAHNLGHVVFNGIESNVSLKLNKFISSIQLGYTFIDVGLKQVENYQSNYALSNLRHQLTAMVLVNWNKNIVHTITYKHIERELLPNYSLVDSKIMYLFKYAGVFAEVSNIFNTSYIEAGFVEMPGRWVKIGANLKLNFK